MRRFTIALGIAAAVVVAGLSIVWGDGIRRVVMEPFGGTDGSVSRKAKGGGPVVPVMTAIAVERDMPVELRAPGTVEPLATVAIKPRVDGQISEMGFKEGDLVTAGQVLFRFDDRLALAQIRLAEANIAKDRALLQDAIGVLKRRELLLKQNYVSEAVADTARSTVDNLKASIEAGQALHEAQKTQLDYLTVRAPITGRTGSIGYKLGANVRAADAIALVTINQTKPIAVAFSVAQSELPSLKRALDGKASAEVAIAGGKVLKLPGTISMIDNQVDRQTGTVLAKILVDNEGEKLWPGLAVDVALTVEVKPNVVTVPASAVLPAQSGMIAWVIGPDKTAAIRKITLDRIINQTAYLSDGLMSGERVVTEGQLRLSPGARVNVEEPRAPATKQPEAAVQRPGNRS